MHFFFALVAVCSIILSVTNAATIHKRAAANVESCVSSLNNVITQINILQPSIQTGGIIDTSINYDRLEDAVKAAQGSCCAINVAISEPDADYVTGVLGNITPKVQEVLTTISQKKSDYNIFTRAILRVRIEDLEESTQSVDTCLINFTPESKKSSLQSYIDSINLAFEQARNAFAT
ncbi:hypothetical protein INT47_005106 [Mucor saturninus]|uniref:Uncharacterized protein n=1 Tax=Mucor saturninus TaxID=64648 RepID=A0A8H7UYS8_9FUNG|nr:hypothetical protein INT47_005106 [Mucor saturninus]